MVEKRYYRDYDQLIKAAITTLKKEVSKENYELILKFDKHLSAIDISRPRRLHYLKFLKPLAKWMDKPMNKANKDDIEDVLNKINAYKIQKVVTRKKVDEKGNTIKVIDRLPTNKKYSESTKYDYKVTLKRFYKWVNGGETYPDSVRWIKLGGSIKKDLDAKDMLTMEDIEKLATAAREPMYKAMFYVLIEGGFRAGELLGMRLKDVKPEKRFTQVRVTGKTGTREVILLLATPFLMTWMKFHPDRKNGNAPLWVDLSKPDVRPCKYEAIRKMVVRVAKKAGIKKPVNLHNFRHSSAAINKKVPSMTDSIMKKHYGWKTSEMLEVYGRLSGEDMKDALARKYGLPTKRETVQITGPKECPRCFSMCEPTALFCDQCSLALNPEVARQIKEEEAVGGKVFEEVSKKKLTLDEDTVVAVLREMLKKGDIKFK